MRTIDKIITNVDCTYGAPMGRSDVSNQPSGITHGKGIGKRYDCKVPMISGGYDKGGAYWGIGSELRVTYTKDLTYIHFYRVGR